MLVWWSGEALRTGAIIVTQSCPFSFLVVIPHVLIIRPFLRNAPLFPSWSTLIGALTPQGSESARFAF